MSGKFLILIVTVSVSLAVKAKDQEYNRKQCDKTIGVEKYIVAGSLDDTSPGGKTYNFKKIVGAIENELLGAQDPRPTHFECYTTLFYKGAADAENYWVERFRNSGCRGEDGGIPKVKPESCDAGTWEEFHRSMNLIDSSVATVKNVTENCVERNGKKSCESMNALQGFAEEVAVPIVASKMDQCCDTKSGAAFRILRSYYTYEFGDLNDSDLQKECYKRTRPDNRNATDILGDVVMNCITGIGRGIFESAFKIWRSVSGLFDMAVVAEVMRVLANPKVLAEKLFSFFKAVFEQTSAHAESFTGCFSPAYKADHACKLVSSMAAEFFVGKKAIDLIVSISKASGTKMSALAKKFIDDNPKAKNTLETLKKQANSSANAVGTVSKNTTLKVTQKMKAFSQQMAGKLKSIGNIRDRISSRLKKESPSRSVASTKPNPNGSTTVTAAEVAPAPNVVAPSVAANATSSASTGVASRSLGTTSGGVKSKISSLDFKQLQKELKPFNTANRQRLKNPERYLVDPKRLKGKTLREKLKELEAGAKERMAQVDRLEKAKGRNSIDSKTAKQMRSNIERALNDWKRINNITSDIPVVATQAGSTAQTVARNLDNPTTSPATSATTPKPPTTSTEVPHSSTTLAGTPHSGPTTVAGKSGSSSIMDNVPPISSIDFNRITSAPIVTGGFQTSVNSTVSFVQRAQSSFSAGSAGASVRSSVYGTRSPRGIKTESLRQHKNIEKMYKEGLINENEALAFHRIVVTAEYESLGRASSFSTPYVRIESPNAGPATFSKPPSRTATVAKGVAGGVALQAASNGAENRNLELFSDKNNTSRYTEATIQDSKKVVEKLTSSPLAVQKEFDTLSTEEAIYEKADQLRVKVKTVESTSGPTASEDEKLEITKLLESINTERNRALLRIQGKSPAGKDVPIGLDDPDDAGAKPQTERQPAEKQVHEPKVKADENKSDESDDE